MGRIRLFSIAALLIIVVPRAAHCQAPIDVVKQERAAVTVAPPIGTTVAFGVTTRVAARLGMGVLRKTSGNNVNGFAVDIVCRADGELFDILGDSEGAGNPQWSDVGPGDRSLCVIPPPGAPAPPPPGPGPTPEPPPATVDYSPVLLRIVALLEDIKAGQAQQTDAIAKAALELKLQIAGGLKIRF